MWKNILSYQRDFILALKTSVPADCVICNELVKLKCALQQVVCFALNTYVHADSAKRICLELSKFGAL